MEKYLRSTLQIGFIKNYAIKISIFLVVICCVFYQTNVFGIQHYVIDTIAGNHYQGYSGDGGPAINAQLNYPWGVVVGKSGNVYIADSFNHCIRKIDNITKNIYTIAGNGSSGFSGDGKSGAEAKLNFPMSIAVDNSENVYFVDYYNMRIRKIDHNSGIITTVAGNGIYGYSGDGGPATSAEIIPNSVAVDGFGNIYISEDVNHRIREVNHDTGIINTVVGNGSSGNSGDGGAATDASFYSASIAVSAAGNIYFADWVNNRIRKVDHSTGIITTIAGKGTSGFSGDGGPAKAAELFYPKCVALDNDENVYILDSENSRIRMVEHSTGNIYTVAGGGSGTNQREGVPSSSAALTFSATGNIGYIINGNDLCSITIANPAPTLLASAAAGSITGTTSVIASPGDGNHILVRISSSVISTPYIGDGEPTGFSVIDNYISGTNINGVDALSNKYIGVYEIDSRGKVVSFNCLTINKNQIKPTPPKITSPLDGTATNNNQIVVSGQAEPNATVEVNFESDTWHLVTADINGKWIYKPQIPISDGTYLIEAKVVLDNGVASDISNEVLVIIDTKDPAAPVILEPYSGMSIKNSKLVIFGYSEAFANITYYINGINRGNYSINKNSFFGVPLPALTAGTYSITITAEDRAGNVSEFSKPVNITINPSAASAVLLGTPCDGFITSNNIILFSGITDPNTTVYLWTDDNWKQICTSNIDGYWSYTPATPITDGDHVFAAGILVNGKTIISNSVNLTIKTTAAIPVITSPLSGTVLNNKYFTITGTSESNALVYIYLNNTSNGVNNLYRTYSDNNGNWTYNLIDLNDGNYSISAKIRDVVNNLSGVCNPINITIDSKYTAYTMKDAMLVKDFLLGKASDSLVDILSKEDVDKDGKITSRDYALILKFVQGKINGFDNVNR